MGYNNPKRDYSIGGDIIDSASNEKDLGVIVSENLSVSDQVAKVTVKWSKLLIKCLE